LPAHDSNDATWYVLRYPEDFAPLRSVTQDPSSPFGQPSSPYIQTTLLYDELRGVLELRPEVSPRAADPPRWVAVDVDGEIYLVDDTGTLVVVRCDGSIVPFVCECGILAQPAGLALDRRGYLHVADPAAHRVLVFNPDNGTVQAVLGGGGAVGVLLEPIDVAVSPSGFIYAADRKAGCVAVFSAGMKPLASFATAAAPEKKPQPIALMINADGTLLVADAWWPRLLHYDTDGTRLADVELRSAVAPLLGGDIAMGILSKAYGNVVPRFFVGSCGPCVTDANDGGARLAEVHRALRLLGLSLGQTFERDGSFISRVLDGGRPAVPWHRIRVELNGAPMPGSRVLVETFTSDTATPCPAAPSAVPAVCLPSPDLPNISTTTGSGSLPAGTYYVRFTLYNDSGESDPSPGRAVQLLNSGALTVFPPVSPPIAAVGYKVYIGSASGAETLQATTAGWSSYTQSKPLVAGASAPATPAWTAPRDKNGKAMPFVPGLSEQLVQSPPGRYLWVRVRLQSDDGQGTPSVRAIRIWYPRVSWLNLLPTAYRRDPDSASFLDRFLALFERVFTGVEDRYEEFSRQLNPDAAPLEVINWLAALIDLAFDPSWPLQRRRALVAEAMSLYRSRGTIAGIERYVEIYTGIRPYIVEGWLERPPQPSFLGRPGSILGCLPVFSCGTQSTMVPDTDLWARYAHRFTIYVYIDDTCDAEVALGAVNRILEVNKPAHTVHNNQAIFPNARVGIQSRIGLDFVLGAGKAPYTLVADGSSVGIASAAPGAVLGVDSVLGARRPQYVRRLEDYF
jgi:phage tail-like protein